MSKEFLWRRPIGLDRMIGEKLMSDGDVAGVQTDEQGIARLKLDFRQAKIAECILRLADLATRSDGVCCDRVRHRLGHDFVIDHTPPIHILRISGEVMRRIW